MTVAIELDALCRTFHRRQWGRLPVITPALRGVSLTIPVGSRFGLVGESGSGKTTMMNLIAALDTPTSGQVRVLGQQVSGRGERELGFLRRSLQVVFQDPLGSLDPRRRVADIVSEPLRAQRRTDFRQQVRRALTDVGLETDALDRYPHQFSGGQRQRIAIARSLAVDPAILIADEPVSALDVTVRAQILDVLTSVVADRGMTLLFISHDLDVVRQVCTEVGVLRAGHLIETGLVTDVYANPRDQYTRDLLQSVPTLDVALAKAKARRAG